MKPDPNLPPRPADSRYLSLDACRGMACLLLVTFHATFFADVDFKIDDRSTWSVASVLMRLVRLAWAGVPIFFVVSGYCIAASLDSMRRRPFTLWQYFSRRIRRIYPPLWIMLALGIIYMLVLKHFGLVDPKNEHLPHIEDFTASNWFGNFSATEWWLHRAIGGERHMLMINTWTLGFEEQFYMLMGVVLMAASRRIFAASALITIITILARCFIRLKATEAPVFFFEGPWLLFWAGIFVYQRVNYLKATAARLAEAVMVFGVFYGMYEYRAGKITGNFYIQHFAGEYIIVAYGFALALVLFRRWDAAIVKHTIARPFLFLGKMSYSVYLAHYLPVITVAALLAEHGITDAPRVMMYTLPLCILVMLPLAWLFHITVERRFLNAPQDDAPRKAQNKAYLIEPQINTDGHR